MPSETHSPRSGTRLASSSTRLLPGQLAVLALLLCPLACASNTQPQAFATARDALADLDEFGVLLLKAGLPIDVLPKGRDLSPGQARQLRLYSHLFQPKHSEYAPWLVADVLLLDVALKNEPMPRAELGRRIQEFQSLAVLRPDGYLADALSGKDLQCVGPVVPSDGAYRAGTYEVGTFYKQGEDKEKWQPVEIRSPAAASR
jgi:hypothetical protein